MFPPSSPTTLRDGLSYGVMGLAVFAWVAIADLHPTPTLRRAVRGTALTAVVCTEALRTMHEVDSSPGLFRIEDSDNSGDAAESDQLPLTLTGQHEEERADEAPTLRERLTLGLVAGGAVVAAGAAIAGQIWLDRRVERWNTRAAAALRSRGVRAPYSLLGAGWAVGSVGLSAATVYAAQRSGEQTAAA